jgi:serine phosphatase RsbU (regulator of sigma subunit)
LICGFQSKVCASKSPTFFSRKTLCPMLEKKNDICKMTLRIKYILYSLTIYFCHFSSLAKQSRVDSLLTQLPKANQDTIKIRLLNDLSYEYWDINPNEGLKYANEALLLAEKIKSKTSIAESYSNISRSYRRLTNLTKSLEFGFKSLKIYEEIGDKHGVVRNLVNIGNTYRVQKDFDKSLKYLHQALKLNEEIGDKMWTARNLNSIGNVYKDLKDYPKTLEYYSRSLKVGEEMKHSGRISAATTNLGSVYGLMKEYSKALEYNFRALSMNKQLGEKVGISECYLNIGMVYLDVINEQKKIEITSFLYGTKRDWLQKAKLYCDSAIFIDKEIGHLEGLQWDYKFLISVLKQLGDYRSAFESYEYYNSLKDSISNEESSRRISQLEKNNEEDLKQKEIEIQKLQLQSAKKERIYFIIGLAFVIVFAGFVFRSLRITRKQKQVIEIKSKETEEQKKIIEEKNKDITDSITYAQRIQQAKLPDIKEIQKAFPNSFVLFKPKDIVSGDFYYFHKNEKIIFIASADCTGHGVPGAFMSMIGFEKLDTALANSVDTSEILKHLNIGIKNSLHQTDSNESTRDGMDIALCSIDTENRIIKYAGANRPLWIIRNGATEVQEIKATKTAIGGLTEDNQHFDTHDIKLLQGDTIYMCTDGFADQFNGQDGKKLMTKKFKEILLSIQDKSMNEQEHYLDRFILDWKAETEQVDDILVIGVRL